MLSSIKLLAVVACALPSTFAWTLRRLEYQDALSFAPPSCSIQDGVDIVDSDILNTSGSADTCCNACGATYRCKAWSWTNLNGGTCWLKAGSGTTINNANVKSAIFNTGTFQYCQIQDDLDYVGNDIANVPAAKAEECCDRCRNYDGCAAYSWSNHNGGTCWLKNKADKAVFKSGVRSAIAYSQPPGSCTTFQTDVDFVGNDIGNKPSSNPGGCCGICAQTKHCRAFTWSNHNGGTCWLKNLKGNAVYKSGVISSQIYFNPDPACTLQNNIDYVNNDIANVPSADPYLCCSICREYTGCKAFSWTKLNGGTCWLKSKKGKAINKAGVQSCVI